MLAKVRPGSHQEPSMRVLERASHVCLIRLDLRHTHTCGLPGLRGTLPPQPERGDADEVGPYLLLGSTRQGPHHQCDGSSPEWLSFRVHGKKEGVALELPSLHGLWWVWGRLKG